MAQMEFSVVDEAQYNWFDHVPEAVDAYEQAFREVQLEERLGFKAHWVIEHQGHSLGQIQTPVPYLAAMAQHTSTIRIGAMVFLIPFYNPIRLAMDAAMIDQLSRGRLDFGAGIGGNPDSFKSWGLPFYEERRQEGPEALDIIVKAWTQDRVTYHGKWWNYDNVIPLPHPYQKPHPPIWFAGQTRSSLELSVERGYGLGMFLHPDDQIAETVGLWKQLWKDSGKKGLRPPSFLTRSVYVAETDEEAYEVAAQYLPQAYTWGEDKFDVDRFGDRNLSEDTPQKRRGQEMFRGMRTGIEFWLTRGLAYVGSPETVIRSLEKSQEIGGWDIFSGRFRFGPMPDELVENSLTLFGEKVIPAFDPLAEHAFP